MSDDPVRILLVEDETDHAELIRRAFELSGAPAEIAAVATLGEARVWLAREVDAEAIDLVIADWRLPDGDGLELVPLVAGLRDVPIVIMTSHGNEQLAVEAIKNGALEYVVKSERTLADMPQTALRALRQWRHIVERRRAEAALRDSEERYRLITEQATDIICLIDQAGQFLYVSPSVQRLLGHAPVAMVGSSAYDYVHPADQHHVRDRWEQFATHGQAQVTCRCLHSDGSWRWFDIQGSMFVQEGSQQAVIVARDVTERRRLEEQLFQAQKLEAIGQLAGGVAHDFNNLLVVITGCAELAMGGLPPEHPARAELVEILKAGRRASSLTRQLLTFARRESSEPQVLNLNELVLDLEKMLRRLIREDIRLRMLPTGDLWPVAADAGQLEQVIVNLAVNARDAMPHGGQLTIETANVASGGDEDGVGSSLHPGPYVRLTVTDTGVGMSEEVRRHAFEPFFTTKGPGEGTGFGLATCYGIVKQHGGEIFLFSELGRGTSARVYLPRAREGDEPRGLYSDEEPLPHGSETVLLVEDEPAVRLLTARALRDHGYRVLEAPDGAAALEVAITQPGAAIDLVLSDLVVPKLSGAELVNVLRGRFPSIRALLMSGYADGSLHANGLLEQGVEFIQKPFSTGALVTKVRAVLDGHGSAR